MIDIDNKIETLEIDKPSDIPRRLNCRWACKFCPTSQEKSQIVRTPGRSDRMVSEMDVGSFSI